MCLTYLLDIETEGDMKKLECHTEVYMSSEVLLKLGNLAILLLVRLIAGYN